MRPLLAMVSGIVCGPMGTGWMKLGSRFGGRRGTTTAGGETLALSGFGRGSFGQPKLEVAIDEMKDFAGASVVSELTITSV